MMDTLRTPAGSSRRRRGRRLDPTLGALLAVLGAGWAHARADIFTPVVSYEAAETGLTVSANAGDPGLTVAIVEGGVGGAPAATDGSRMLKITVTNEADRKVEFRHNWSASTYSLDGAEELLADVYIASSGALPGLMGIWSANWSPPDPWQQASGIPTGTGVWKTVSFNVASRAQVGLNYIGALVFENMAATSGVAYVDNLRLRSLGGPQEVAGFAANAYAAHVRLVWRASTTSGLQGYNVYRSDLTGGPFVKLNGLPLSGTGYDDATEGGAPRRYYYVGVQVGGTDVAVSEVVAAQYDGLTDDQLLNTVQRAHFRYFYDYAHPNCRMAREGVGMGHSLDTVTTGGTGMGLMTLIVGAERGFATRSAIADRVRTILSFLQNVTPRYHGAWSHHYNGNTGATIAFAGIEDNGGDLVETAFLVEGILAVRQYFDDPADPAEAEIRTRATQMWEGVEWDWYRRYAGGNVLYWHWSPNYGWDLNHQIRGYNEAQMVYLLAIASPTHPMPAGAYHYGWVTGGYVNGTSYYGLTQWVGEPLGGPLFFTHYSNLGFDPRYKRDAYANYHENARNISRIHHAYAIDNPGDHAGYDALSWGLTASFNPWGYSAHSPTNDNGTIAPTAALSAMPYTPEESLAATRHFYDTYGSSLFGFAGFYDAFNPDENWFAPGYIAIDQGPVAPMIENYRSGLCWRMFMSNPEIRPMLTTIGMYFEADFDTDGDIDTGDYAVWADCVGGPGAAAAPAGCLASDFADSDLDNDGDVDLNDAAIFQSLFDAP